MKSSFEIFTLFVLLAFITGFVIACSSALPIEPQDENINENTEDGTDQQQETLKVTDKIAFISSHPDGLSVDEVFIMDSDGSNVIRLTNDDLYEDDDPAFSPDGSKIAFSSRRGNRDIYLINPDGSNLTNLTNSTLTTWNPAWSPDGSRIAFDANNPGSGNGWAIYIIDKDGSNLTQLTSSIESFFGPVWSPDGSRIVYSGSVDRTDNEIFVMNSDGTNKIQLTNNEVRDIYPTWSPDGTKIVFRSDSTPDVGDIFIMDSDGANLINLTNTKDVFERWPSWKYGSKIAYSAYSQELKVQQIFLMDPDGSNIIQLTNGARKASQPSLSPVSINK